MKPMEHPHIKIAKLCVFMCEIHVCIRLCAQECRG